MPSDEKIDIEHHPDRQRFEARIQNEVAFLSYTTQGDIVSLDHTFVPDTLRGRGVAAELVQAAVNEARQQHWKIRPRCSYVVTFFKRHPEVADVAETHDS